MVESRNRPLARRLGIPARGRVCLLRGPPAIRSRLAPSLARCELVPPDADGLDWVLLFGVARAELLDETRAVARRLAPAGTLWIAWPKRASGQETDLDDHSVRSVGLAAGLVDVKVCAIDSTWSGLRFVRRRSDRTVRKNPHP